jgi:hypothetical protein
MVAMNKCLARKSKFLEGGYATKNHPHKSLSCRAFVGRNCLTPVCEDKMDLEFTLIDCATGLIYGPYETFLQARERAEGFERWEINNRVGNLIHAIDRPDRNRAGGVNRGTSDMTRPYVVSRRILVPGIKDSGNEAPMLTDSEDSSFSLAAESPVLDSVY